MKRIVPCHDRLAVSTLGRRGFMKAASASAASLWLAGRGSPSLGEEQADVVPRADERMKALLDASPMTMQFRSSTGDDCRCWQAEFGAKLRSLLGPFQPPAKWHCMLERRVELDAYVREHRVLKADDLAPVPFYLLLPRKRERRRAGILAIHGHGECAPDAVAGVDDTPEQRADIEKFRYDYGRKLAERGYVVAAPCLTPFGRRLGIPKKARKGGDPCTLVNLQLQHLGKLLITENLRDILWTLEFLVRQETVDSERIGCVGLSYGGRMTMMAAALEPRIRVATIAGALNCFQERAAIGSAAGCQVIPGLLQYGDVPEIGSLIAPRPCVWEAGSEDQHVPADWAEKAMERMRRVYAALGAADQLFIDRFEGGHQWHGDVAYRVLEKALRS